MYAADQPDPSFLQRYLAMFDSLLYDLDQRGARRDMLVDPSATPVEALAWLASFVGLVLDDRWPEVARRRLLTEIVPLYRRRGTVGALSRYLELFLGRPPVIVEHYRLRGLAPVPGDVAAASSRAVVGGRLPGRRRGRPLGAAPRAAGERTSPRPPARTASPWWCRGRSRPSRTPWCGTCWTPSGRRTRTTSCARWTRACARERACTSGSPRVVGPTGAVDPLVAGGSVAGRGTVLGGATSGLAVEAARLDRTARVG